MVGVGRITSVKKATTTTSTSSSRSSSSRCNRTTTTITTSSSSITSTAIWFHADFNSVFDVWVPLIKSIFAMMKQLFTDSLFNTISTQTHGYRTKFIHFLTYSQLLQVKQLLNYLQGHKKGVQV